MVVRSAFDVPWWQLALSMGSLVLTFLLMVWVSGKIYRTGLLMYGKKVNWKELMKWLWYKD
jgi:ABC-2 type transport system permease protein